MGSKCEHCGGPLPERKERQRGRVRRFCCSNCRVNAWKAENRDHYEAYQAKQNERRRVQRNAHRRAANLPTQDRSQS